MLYIVSLMDKSLKEALMKVMMSDFTPFPLDKSICTGWATNEPRGGRTILYTGCMYQVVPLSAIFDRFIPILSKNRLFYASLLNLAKKFHPDKPALDRSYKILRSISSLLKKNGINFGYMYDDEPYSGAFLLELGMLSDFERYATLVREKFKQQGVKRIITIDPHSHNALSRYSEFITFDIDVVNYMELLREVGIGKKGDFVIHDSCLYSRFLNKREVYRELLKKAGVSFKEDYMVTSKENSLCCGGPLSPIDERVSKRIGEYRANQLKKVSEKVIVQCPFCYVNLSPYVEAYDIAEVIDSE